MPRRKTIMTLYEARTIAHEFADRSGEPFAIWQQGDWCAVQQATINEPPRDLPLAWVAEIIEPVKGATA